MLSSEDFFKTPAALEFFTKFQLEILKAQRPADQVIMDEVEFCNFLHISKRHSANLRAIGAITYSKAGGKIYYRLSDVIDFIEKNEIKCVNRSRNIFKNKNHS